MWHALKSLGLDVQLERLGHSAIDDQDAWVRSSFGQSGGNAEFHDEQAIVTGSRSSVENLGIGVTDFGGPEDGNAATIPPDRAGRAGLDYLALGDWHGQQAIGPRTWYAGTPEPDSFRHADPGRALAVQLPAPGAPPQVTPVATGQFRWQRLDLTLLPGASDLAQITAHLPAGPARGDHLVDLRLTGRLGLSARAALHAGLDTMVPDFWWFACDDQTDADITQGDLDQIDRAGALRLTADRLVAETRDPALSAPDRARAARALDHLFAMAQAAP